ncbi:MAG TPA: ACT domain-containing protein [Gemmatimonadaceae bacterium]
MSAREHLILSATERDRPGLVAELSGFIAKHGCNVEDSRVVVLGGYAGLMFLISGSTEAILAVEGGLPALERETGLRAVARRLVTGGGAPAERPAANTYVVTASAIDHEGLIHLITDTVRSHGGNILELETSTESAPMSGSPLFALRMVVALAERHGSRERLRVALEVLARSEAIDLDLVPAAEGAGGAGGRGRGHGATLGSG